MSDRMQTVQGRCPACGWTSLFLGDGGYITCSRLECPRPDLVTELLGEIADARQHAAFTFCEQNIGHATMAAFAQKISEKRTALAQREEAVQYANEQKQRAEHAEAAITRIREVARWARRNYPGLTNLNDRLAAALDQPAPAAAAQATDEPEQCTACRPGVRCVKHCTCTECAVFQRPSGSTPQRG